jgi:hypothetical protein
MFSQNEKELFKKFGWQIQAVKNLYSDVMGTFAGGEYKEGERHDPRSDKAASARGPVATNKTTTTIYWKITITRSRTRLRTKSSYSSTCLLPSSLLR